VIHFPAARHAAHPWKNGLGTSHTIADFPRGAGFDALLWQVGHTGIGADCPFSDLPGLDRQFMVIEGAGVELTCVDEAGRTTVNRVGPLQPAFPFRGDWRTSCRLLDGPVKVFNVMTRRASFSAKVEIVPSLDSIVASPDETLIAMALSGLDAWMLDGPLPGVGRAVLVRIRRENP
jgi:environmental stress-induced protein Ves